MDQDFIRGLKENGLWYFYLVSLFSSDTLIDLESCEKSLGEIEKLEKIIQDPDDIEWVKKAKEVVLQDLERFKQQGGV